MNLMIVLLLLPLAGAVICPLLGRMGRGAREMAVRLFTLGELALSVLLFLRVWRGEEAGFAVPDLCGIGLLPGMRLRHHGRRAVNRNRNHLCFRNGGCLSRCGKDCGRAV